MASPGELRAKTAEVLGVPEATIIVHDRNLVVAGLRSKGGRGRSAAKVTPTDAANLLIAVSASSLVKDTVATVEEYARLPCGGGGSSGERPGATSSWTLSEFAIPQLTALPAEHALGDALTALIEAARDGDLEEAVKSAPPGRFGEHDAPKYWAIEVMFWGPYAQASIRIKCNDFDEYHDYSLIPTEKDEIDKWAEEHNANGPRGDLKQINTFSARTIMAMGELLKN